MQLYDKIQILRKKQNLTQAMLAEKLNVSRQAVQKWEAGLAAPDVSKLPELAKLFNVSIDYLLSKEEEIEIGSDDQKNTVIQNTTIIHKKSAIVEILAFTPIWTIIFTLLSVWFLTAGAFVVIVYASVALLPLASIFAIPLLVFNINAGAGAILISISCLLLGVTCGYFCYLSCLTCWNYFKKCTKFILKKITSIKIGGTN